jgi:hypothetical protein
MVVLSGELPAIGDLVMLPHWTAPPDTWFRVLGVSRDEDAPGWCRLDGYVILPSGRQRLGRHRVPVAGLVIDRE